MDARQSLQKLQQADAKRRGFPGEHVAVLGAGLALLLLAGRKQSVVRRALTGAAGGALVGRAASGTGGLSQLLARLRTLPAWQRVTQRQG